MSNKVTCFSLVEELLLRWPFPYFLSSICEKYGLNILIYLQEIKKRALQYPDLTEFQWKLVMW